MDVQSTADEIQSKIQMARQTSGFWQGLTVKERAAYLNKVKNVIYRERLHLIDLMIHDGGRIRFSAEGLLFETLNNFSLWKKADRLLRVNRLSLSYFSNRKKRCVSVYEPYGVVGIIAPANSPFFECFQQIIQALLMGNSVVVKPPESSPKMSLEIERLIRLSGLPEGVVNIVHGGAAVGDALVRSSYVNKIVFFGTTAVGRKVIEASADTVKPLFLGLEGAEYALVLKDCWQERTLAGLTYGAFCHSGQNCSCIRHVLIDASIAEEMTKELVERARRLRLGDRGATESEIGGLLKCSDAQNLLAAIQEARDQGAVLLAGGEYDQATNRISPVIMTRVTADMRLMKESFVGPYMCLHSISDPEDAVGMINRSRYGLSASVWTRDIRVGERIARSIKAGTVWVNESQLYHWDVPYGGTKLSGYGKSSGTEGLLSFAFLKVISQDSTDKNNFYWFPYDEKKLALMRTMLSVKHDPLWWNRIRAFFRLFIRK